MADEFMTLRGATGPPRWAMVALLLTMAGIFPGCHSAEVSQERLPAHIAGRAFQLELALDDAARAQGLSDRKSIAPDGGMLFIFPDVAVREFVMRRCYVQIDILFISPAGRIVSMHEMQVEPMDRPEHLLRRYTSGEPAMAAIEFAGGTIRALGLKPGERIDLPWADLKQRAR